MNVREMLDELQRSVTSTSVFGEPVVRGGVTLVPVARVRGMAGGGGGDRPDESGSGAGLGIDAKVLGAYVVKDDSVRWIPAIDVNKAILGGQVAWIVSLFAAVLLRRARRSKKRG